ncbi:hypothetical protein NW768_004100 [Fusarium equiseti]|uniref:Uncharacterized protein n=1 Tax=Fusarium equiseti TaxID=61235 RepID=A0ABQ8RJR7_FUSEQ|nr:hypothetical protein NW768_004100 [Fusarium equiseti]
MEIHIVDIVIVAIIVATIIALTRKPTPVDPEELWVIRGEYRNPGFLHLKMLPYSYFKPASSVATTNGWRHRPAEKIKENGFQCLTSKDTLTDELDALAKHVFEEEEKVNEPVASQYILLPKSFDISEIPREF